MEMREEGMGLSESGAGGWGGGQMPWGCDGGSVCVCVCVCVLL